MSKKGKQNASKNKTTPLGSMKSAFNKQVRQVGKIATVPDFYKLQKIRDFGTCA